MSDRAPSQDHYYFLYMTKIRKCTEYFNFVVYDDPNTAHLIWWRFSKVQYIYFLSQVSPNQQYVNAYLYVVFLFISNWYDGVNVILLWIAVVVYRSIFLLNCFKWKHLFFNTDYCCILMWWLEGQWHFWHVLLFAHLFCCVKNKNFLGPVSI